MTVKSFDFDLEPDVAMLECHVLARATHVRRNARTAYIAAGTP